MEKIILTNSEDAFKRVYNGRILERMGLPAERFSSQNLEENKEKLKDCRFIFSTWGMPELTEKEIRQYFPSLEAVFYSAGTVGYFAKPFLNCGVRIFSAAYANGIPVAEYTLAQITLATKGYFQSAKLYRFNLSLSRRRCNEIQGNYKAKVGLIGLGVIGTMVAEKLRELDVEVLAYDPFAVEEKADALGVKLTDLPTLFAQCDVVSNHLANKEELNNILNYDLFRLMKANAVFINTGRGSQVDEKGLARALREAPARTAVLDVQKNESKPFKGPLWWCPNVVMTPHIAGSTGNEVTRMSDYMIDQYRIYIEGGRPESEVTLEKLKTMA